MAAEPQHVRAGSLVRVVGVVTVVAFIALLVYGVIAKAPDHTIDDRLTKAQTAPAPGFKLAVLEQGRLAAGLIPAWRRAAADGQVGLTELRGTPVVLNFWASWCDPCRAEAPILRAGAERWGERGVLYLGLDMQDITAEARLFVREFKLDFPHVRDPTNATAREWGVTGIPETFFISAAGEVVGHVIGTVTAQQLDAGAAAARSGQPLSASQGGARRPTR